MFATMRTFRGDMRTYLTTALPSMISLGLVSKARKERFLYHSEIL